MAGYEVDPAALAASGKTVGAQGDALIAALDALESALTGSGLMCGTDSAGLAFFLNYQKGGQAVISAAESAVNATRNVGYGVEVSAHNYAMSDSVSTVGGGRESIPEPTEPTKYLASGVGGQSGPQIPPPSLWSLVQQFVSANWPNGNPETVRTVAAAWRGLGTAISTVSSDAGGVSAGLAGHTIPELSSITGAVNDLTSGTRSLADQCAALANSLESFAGEVQSSQDAIRDLLHRLSVSGILDELGKIFTGHNPMDDVRQIGHDISEILHTLSRELDAEASGIQMLIDGMDGLVRKFEEWDRKEFTRFLGDDVGNIVANAVNTKIDNGEGLLKSGLNTVKSVPEMLAHPVDTAEGMAKIGKEVLDVTTPLGMLDGDYAESGKNLLDVGKNLVHYDEWDSERPGVVTGEITGDIAQMFIPGVGEAKGGLMAGKAGEEAAQAARASRVARGLDAVAQGSGKEVAAQAGKIEHDLDGLGSKPVEAPKVVEPAPAPHPAEPAPAPKADSGAAAGNSTGGKAPVDVGTKPAAESGAAHGGGSGEAPGSRAPVEHAPTAHSPSESVPATHGSGEAAHAPASEAAPATHPARDGAHAPAATEHAPQAHSGSPAPHDAPATRDMAEAHSGGGHGSGHSEAGGDHGGNTHGGDVGTGDGATASGDDGILPKSHEAVEGHDYGFSPENAFQHSIDRDAEIARLHEGGVPASVTDGYEPLAGQTAEQYKHNYTFIDENGRLRWDWDRQAPNNGFLGDPIVADRIPQGHELDRLGSNSGGFMADEGAPLSTRAMPPGVANDYHTFEGTGRRIPDGLNWEVQYGPAKDAYGQPGGATQWAVIDRATQDPIPVDELIRRRLIRDTTPQR